MSVLWTSAEAAQATGGTATSDWRATGVSIDTRTLAPGDLFVALKATRDGHEFVGQALAAGAAAALVTHRPEGVAGDAPLIVVDDVQAALEALGQHARARTAARVAAITGSVGKTSSKEMLRAALTGQGRVHAAEASYNNHWGVPLTLARMPADTDFAVLEIGMNHPGEIAPLARIARPHVVMVTTVAAAHLEAFDDIDGIAREKASICEGLEPGGIAVLNADVPQAGILRDAARAAGARIVTFGADAGADWTASELRISAGMTVAAATGAGREMHLKVANEGRHFAINALGVLAAAEALGGDLAQSLMGLASWAPPAGRGARETIRLDAADPDLVLTLLDDSYNANPTSMAAALAVLAGTARGAAGRGRRVAFLGDMKELGGGGEAMHTALADLPAMEAIDTVHCVGPLMAGLHAALPPARRGHRTETAAEMADLVRPALAPGDAVLVKGSLSTGLGTLVDAVRKMGHSDA